MSIITCPDCKIRVIANVDGKCPSCRTDLTLIIRALQYAPESKPDEAPPIKLQHVATSPFAPPETIELPIEQSNHFDVFHVLFSFCGRIPRSIYWLAAIMGPLVLIVLFVFAEALLNEDSQLLGWIGLSISFAMIWMSFAVGVKRLHDLDWTGWLIVFGLIPGLGQLFLLFTAGMMRGTDGLNRYGPDPLKLLK